MRDLIILVPDHCIYFIFLSYLLTRVIFLYSSRIQARLLTVGVYLVCDK